MKSVIDTMMLSNQVKIPCVGFGVFQVPDGEVCEDAVCQALKLGYRHIDTATAYGNEVSVGKGIKKSDVERKNIFLTTKHWITERGYEKTIQAVEDSLTRLGTDYIDLYLIHWPLVEKTSPDWKAVNASTWKGFEKMYKEGKIRAIGVSNFLPHHLEALMETAEIAPMVNQIEFHPGFNQLETVKWCQERGILVQAWSALGSGRLLGHPLLAELAEKYGKSPAHICLRYALQHGVLPLTKSVHEERIRSNMDIFDFILSDEDMKKLDDMEQVGYSGWHPDDAPAETYYD